jgi:hypothetical protein
VPILFSALVFLTPTFSDPRFNRFPLPIQSNSRFVCNAYRRKVFSNVALARAETVLPPRRVTLDRRKLGNGQAQKLSFRWFGISRSSVERATAKTRCGLRRQAHLCVLVESIEDYRTNQLRLHVRHPVVAGKKPSPLFGLQRAIWYLSKKSPLRLKAEKKRFRFIWRNRNSFLRRFGQRRSTMTRSRIFNH